MDPIELSVNYGDGTEVKIAISGFTSYRHVIQSLHKLGQDDYLLGLYRALTEDEEDED